MKKTILIVFAFISLLSCSKKSAEQDFVFEDSKWLFKYYNDEFYKQGACLTEPVRFGKGGRMIEVSNFEPFDLISESNWELKGDSLFFSFKVKRFKKDEKTGKLELLDSNSRFFTHKGVLKGKSFSGTAEIKYAEGKVVHSSVTGNSYVLD